MAQHVAIYTLVHQPRRLKLPAQPIPLGADPVDIARCLFDERLNRGYFEAVARRSYYPATEQLAHLLDDGLKLSIGFTQSFLRQAVLWDERLLDQFRQIVRHERVELVAVEPYHGFSFLLDLPAFVHRMEQAAIDLASMFGRTPRIADATALCMSDPIYAALNRAGFAGALMDGRPAALEWRQPTYLYRHGRSLTLLARHAALSAAIPGLLRQHGGAGALAAEGTIARLRHAEGAFVLLTWDVAAFGEPFLLESAMLPFWARLVGRHDDRGWSFALPSEVVATYETAAYDLPLSATVTTGADDGDVGFFLDNPAQRATFSLLQAAYNKARLSGNAELIDLAWWLAQSDHFQVLHESTGEPREEPDVDDTLREGIREWRRMGSHGIAWHIQQVYRNFVAAIVA